MKFSRRVTGFFLAAAVVLVPVVFAAEAGESVQMNPMTGKPVAYAGQFSSARVMVPDVYRPKMREMRGVWMATVENIDFAPHTDAAAFRRDYLTAVENLKRANFNAVIFQVRPMNDAFYPSKLNPWSRWMTGTEGRGLGAFDPLDFMVKEAHRRGLEFHAWLNPYRVVSSTKLRKMAYLNTLDRNNFARRNPHCVLEVRRADGTWSLLLNPGDPRVIRHILATVREIVESYPVDAIHFDDYFYLYGGIGTADYSTFHQYNPHGLALEDWRRANVDAVVRGVKNELTAYNRRSGHKVVFGISPFGIWANRKDMSAGSLTGGLQSFFVQHADTRGWVKKGWIDYIAPQLYWPFSQDVAAYAALADWWSEVVKGTNVNLYIGHAAYRLGAERRWPADELADQLRYNCKRGEIDGSIFFSYRNVFTPSNRAMREGVGKVLRDYWRSPALPPIYRNVQP